MGRVRVGSHGVREGGVPRRGLGEGGGRVGVPWVMYLAVAVLVEALREAT